MSETNEIEQNEVDKQGEQNQNEEEEDKICYDIPQNTDEIEKIVQEAKLTKNLPPQYSKTAQLFEYNLEKDDPILWETKEDGSCTLYSIFYVVYRDPYLKSLFHSCVRKDETDYFFYLRILNDYYTIKIPISLIPLEKERDKNKIYPTNDEYLLIVSILTHVITFMKVGFIDRLAFQPFLQTDMFFDRPFTYIGEKTNIEVNKDKENSFFIITNLHKIELQENGLLIFEDGTQKTGHFIFTIGFYPKGWTFGHCFSVYYCFESNKWLYYNTLNDPEFGVPGEKILNEVLPLECNGLSILSGVETETV